MSGRNSGLSLYAGNTKYTQAVTRKTPRGGKLPAAAARIPSARGAAAQAAGMTGAGNKAPAGRAASGVAESDLNAVLSLMRTLRYAIEAEQNAEK
jgi:hypothetical protein